MGNPLHDRRTAAEFAATRQIIEFADKISTFEGLAEIVEADLAALDPEKPLPEWRESLVRGALEFGYADERGQYPMVRGSATARVTTVCQRCLEPFELELSVEPRLLLLPQDEAADGYDDYEVWELDERTMRPRDIVEELLIMALPMSAMHDRRSECRVLASIELQDESTAGKPVRPFAALRRQMTQNENDPDE